ncbi:MAG TPA: M13 family metallopeptidase N-terminal domain-containing protein, partial [Chitinophagaceae bacterium]|nr:M13 family metallopeptidase N-terminal domain-containing protein [Chitinophagaceae bacterium]
MKNFFFFLLVVTSFAACNTTPEKKFIAIQGIDSTRKPGDNFFLYADGKWYDTAQIPATQAGVGTYMFMNYPQRLRLQQILDSVSQAKNQPGSIEQKVGDFYASGMDTVTINKRGDEPIRPLLARIDAVSDVPSLLKFVADEEKHGNTTIIGFSVEPDQKNSSMNIAQAYQTGIGLPDRDYYFNTDAATVVIQEAYKKYLATLFELTGSDADAAKKAADLVYSVDKQLAASHRTRVELRDVTANYNKIAVADLEKRQPLIGWRNFLNNIGAKTDSIDVGQPAYYDQLNKLLKSIPVSDWKIYLKANLISNYANVLSQPFVDAAFAYTKAISGQAVQKSRGEIMAN